MSSSSKKSLAPAKQKTLYQRGDSVTVWRSNGIRDDKPAEIFLVARCNQRDVELSNGQKFKVSYSWLRPTKREDAAQIERDAIRKSIGNIDRDELDHQALVDLAPLVKAWRAREARRELAIVAALRSALIDGPQTRGDLGSITARFGVKYDKRDRYIDKAGVHAALGSTRDCKIYQRISTDEDRFNAILMGAFAKNTTVTMDVLLDAVIAKLGGTKDEREPEVVMALGRCGAVMVKGFSMGRAVKLQLQPFDKPGS